MTNVSRTVFSFYILLCALFVFSVGIAHAEKRVALVIGTDNYQNLPILQKAVNDARAVSKMLKEIGFAVIKGENLTRRQMNRSLANLERTISPGDQVFFFFAGHGVALGATNYLIPADMPLPEAGEESLVRGEAFAVDQIVERIQSRGAIASFVVLDACRNNPFKTKGVRAIGSSRGLRDISAPRGVFVLFSAGIGQTALDRLHDGDKNPNSVFTRNLVPLLNQPGLSHVQLAKRVQSDVDKLARTVRHEQQPAYYDQVIGNMYLVTGESNARPKKQTAKLITPAPREEAKNIYNDIKNSGDITALEIFAKQFPNSIYSKFALGRVNNLRNQNTTVNSPSTDLKSALVLKPKKVHVGRSKQSVTQKAYLYEESTAGSSASRDVAAIIWSMEYELLDDGNREAVIKGQLDVPGRNLTMTLLIKRNRSESLPASHIIELQFQPPKDFSGGYISDVSRFVMKTSEQGRGEGLIAVPAKISDNNFLIALNNLEQALATNDKLMLDSSWIDVPLGYMTGRRALVTLEKGAPGDKIFRDAYEDWNRK